ncbi:MAG: hypothetical protein JWP63_1543 [Candidatus Solibacter sp.]|nr:hypothetical protein [Candidatus Solibacter sp.]
MMMPAFSSSIQGRNPRHFFILIRLREVYLFTYSIVQVMLDCD